jgi:Tol biopolymer transport system component
VNRLDVVGREAPVVEGVRRASFVGGSSMAAYYDISDSGSLAYIPGRVTTEVRFDLGVLDPRSGTTPMNLLTGGYEFPRVSPNGKSILVGSNDGRTAHIWLFDRSGANAFRQLTFTGKNRFPIWSTDNQFVTFQSDREGDLALFRQRADGSGIAERLTKPASGTEHIPAAWMPGDGTTTLLFEAVTDSQRTLWTRSADGTLRRFGDALIAQSLGGPIDAAISPNGRWVAYKAIAGSGASRGPVITVEPASPDGTKHLIGNGLHPTWSRDGKTLFFRQLTTGAFFAARILSESPFAFETPQRLPITFTHRQSNSSARSYDVMPEGTFVGVIPAVDPVPEGVTQINIVLNWHDELKRLVPTN